MWVMSSYCPELKWAITLTTACCPGDELGSAVRDNSIISPLDLGFSVLIGSDRTGAGVGTEVGPGV